MLAVGGSLFVGLSADAPGSTATANRWAFVGFAVLAGLLLWRLGGVRATASDAGLLVRNILRTRRLAWAEVLGARDIFIGVNALDYSGYPDCRPEFVRAFETMANLAIKEAVEGRLKITVHAPLMQWNKARIIEEGMKLGVDYGLTHSCYDPETAAACGRCDACRLRLQGFAEVGIADPAPYRNR